MASAGSAILITVICVGRLSGVMWLRRGWWARTPWALLLDGGTVMVSLSLIRLRRDDALTGKRVEIRVGRVVGLKIDGRSSLNMPKTAS